MPQELPEGTVTILFTDVVGSTEIRTDRGDAPAHELMQAHFDLVRQQIEQHSGQEVKTIGDSFMVAFGSARRAVDCAVAVQRALAEQRRQHPDGQLHVRIGLNTGEVIHDQEDLFGAAVDAAARIYSKAAGDQIFVPETVRAIMGPATDIEFIDRGLFRLKGFPERWRLYEVAWQEEQALGAPALLERTPFVGRETERSELRRLLEQTLGGRGALVMIGGEPGVGKTRIAEELMAEASERGALALIGHCYEMEGGAPYIPFVEIVEAATRVVTPETFRETLGDSAGEMAKLIPELRRAFPDIPPPLELPPEQERHYLFKSVQEFLDRASSAQPIVLVLDDLHWADDSTLLLVQHIAQHLSEMSILIIGTYRDVELDVDRPLAKALEELLRQRLAHRIAIRRLPEQDVAAMLRAASGQEPPSALVQVIYSETEGLPFFVEEIYQHLAEEGKLFDAEGHWRADLEVGELDVPEGVRLVIGRRLQRVSEETRRVLASAAVVGRVFSYDLLQALSETDPDVLLDAVDEAERAQLIAATDGGREARFTFVHELIRQTLLSSLSLPRRQRLHLRVAEAMERVYAAAPEERAADLAHHLFQAGAAADQEKTARYLTLAAEQALASAAFEEALRYCENALSILPDGEDAARADLLYRRGGALRSLGRWEEGMADWEQALTAYEQLSNIDGASEVAFQLAQQLIWNARWLDSVEVVQRGLAVLAEGASVERGRLLAMEGGVLGLSGDYDAAQPVLAQARAMAEELDDQQLLSLTSLNRASLHMWYMQAPQAIEPGLQAIELLRSDGDLWGLADASWMTQYALISLGRFDEGARLIEEAAPLAERLGHLGAVLAIQRGKIGAELITIGDLDSFEAASQADLELCRSAEMPWISNSYNWMGQARFWRGRWPEALEHFEEGARLEPPGMLNGWDWVGLFLMHAYMQERDAAMAGLNEKRSLLPQGGRANTLGSWILLLRVVEGLAVLGEREEAAQYYPLLLEAIATGCVVQWFGILPQHIAGIAAACGRQWDEAREHFEAALRQAHELPAVIAQPEVRRWYARMLIDRDGPGDRDKARALLAEANELYGKIGMPKHVEMAQELLKEAQPA